MIWAGRKRDLDDTRASVEFDDPTQSSERESIDEGDSGSVVHREHSAGSAAREGLEACLTCSTKRGVEAR